MMSDDDQKDDLQQKVQRAQAEDQERQANEETTAEPNAEELKNALARALADLQNYKRRTEEDKAKFVKFANAELLAKLMPVFDNFNRSVEHLPEELKGNDWAKRVVQIDQELNKTLTGLGVKRIETVGQKLDTRQHEALMSGPGEKDVVIEEFEPGYLLNDEVIKPAKVKVGDGS